MSKKNHITVTIGFDDDSKKALSSTTEAFERVVEALGRPGEPTVEAYNDVQRLLELNVKTLLEILEKLSLAVCD